MIIPVVCVNAQFMGCTDRLALNYDPTATVNDGSCLYNPVNIKPVASVPLPGLLAETSGLILWDGYLWTHNDNTDTNIYGLDPSYGDLLSTITLNNVTNYDWEEISQDDNYIYIGDFGNNSGNRTDLHILRILKNSLIANTPVIDTIGFSYSDQTVPKQDETNKTDYDCEAFIVSSDSIYLFTKQWLSRGTSVYSLPKTPGTYVAKLRYSLDVKGLITGSVYIEQERIIVLSGYSKSLDPFFYLLYDFPDHEFFKGNKRKIEVALPFHQIEGITTSDGIRYYATNENFIYQPLVNVRQKLQVFNLSSFLGNYLGFPIPFPDAANNFIISPVPVRDQLTIRGLPELIPSGYTLISLSGKIIMRGIIDSEQSVIDVSLLSPGAYILRIGDEKKNIYKLIKE